MDERKIAELRALRGQGLVSAVGKYTPEELLWEALDEIERLRPHAELYRWLRLHANEHWWACFDNAGRHLLEGEELDAGIATAMRQQNGGTEPAA